MKPLSTLKNVAKKPENLPRPMKNFVLHLAALIPLALSGGCSSVEVLNTLSATSSYRLTENIPFGEGARRTLDIYQPKQLKEDAPAPVVVFFYGGSWNRGDKKDYAFIGHSLAAKGYVTVIPDYRLYPEVRYPEFLDDNAAAVAWVFHNIEKYGATSKNLFVMGHSAGAYNASMMALDDRWLKKQSLSPGIITAWVGVSGPYDFLPIGTPDVQPVFFHPDYPKDSQPINYVTPTSTPAFLATSIDDELIRPTRNTIGMAKRLEQNGVSSVLKTYENVDHISIIASVAWPLRFKSPLLADIHEFLQAQMGTIKAAQQ
ncbi:MAG: alpha/beta hydrolase [Burkholderiales bacterium]|nr:alpha/beta hydrolase [Burkholderiales bacterium]